MLGVLYRTDKTLYENRFVQSQQDLVESQDARIQDKEARMQDKDAFHAKELTHAREIADMKYNHTKKDVDIVNNEWEMKTEFKEKENGLKAVHEKQLAQLERDLKMQGLRDKEMYERWRMEDQQALQRSLYAGFALVALLFAIWYMCS